MGIKETIMRNKLAKDSETMMPLLMDNVYKRIKSLTDARFDDEQADLKRLAKTFADDLTSMCTSLEAKLAQIEKQSIDTIKEAGKQSKVDTSQFVAQIKAENMTALQKIAENMMIKVDTVIATVEKMRGPQGEQGIPGPKGKDGSSDTAEQVVAKVNQAKGVKITAIDGLEEELKKAKKAGSGKAGGGMGNIQHETKAINSGTSSVTTTYAIAAGGRACWLFLQGQFLVYGTHYTVNNRTINLLFTPMVDNTNLDITYVRS